MGVLIESECPYPFHEPRFRNAAFRLQNYRHFNAAA